MQYTVYKHEHVAGKVKLVDRPLLLRGGGGDMVPQLTDLVMADLTT